MKNQYYVLKMSSKMYYFDFNFNIHIDFFEIKISNEIFDWILMLPFDY